MKITIMHQVELASGHDLFKFGLLVQTHVEHAQFWLASLLLPGACAGGFAMMFADPRLAPSTMRSLIPITHLFS